VKRWAKRLPVVGGLARAAYHGVRAARERPTAQRRLAAAPHPSAPRIARVLARLHARELDEGRERVAAIEKERAALLARDECLDDGSLGPGGLHDRGVSVAAACRVSKPPNAARLMYLLVREFRPVRAIELGTNVGISSAYQAAGLAANGRGRLVTLEASPYRLRLARELHGRVGLRRIEYRQGLFAETLDAAVAELGPFDFAFIDGHHEHHATLDYFERVWRHAHDDALFVFDDIRWSEGMERAWAALRADPRVRLAVDLYTVGLCVVAREPQERRCVLPPLRYALVE
jgi:predicted O-methyltransferase YrrM